MKIFSKAASSSSIGARGEKAAQNYLTKLGYKILALNFCNPSGRRLGEIDIIAKDGEEIVFVEVKTRSSLNYGLPEENINRAKLYKINKIASFYLTKNGLQNVPHRFDAVILIANPCEQTAKLKHFKSIYL